MLLLAFPLMVMFIFCPCWGRALTPTVAIFIQNPCGAVTLAVRHRSFQERFYSLMKNHCIPDSCIWFLICIGARSCPMMGRLQDHVATLRVSNHDYSFCACFPTLCCCVFCFFGILSIAISIRIRSWALLFFTVIIVISVVQTLEQQTAFLVLTYTCFVCWLQYTIAKHAVSAIQHIFLISVGKWPSFSGHG